MLFRSPNFRYIFIIINVSVILCKFRYANITILLFIYGVLNAVFVGYFSCPTKIKTVQKELSLCTVYLILLHKLIRQNYLKLCALAKLAFGNDAKYYISAAKENGVKDAVLFDDKTKLSDYLASLAQDSDAVLFKGSRGMKLEDVMNTVYKRWEN